MSNILGILQHFSGCTTELTVFVFFKRWLIVLWEHLLFEWVVFVTHSGAPHFHFPSQKINFPANAASAPIAWAIVKFGTVSGQNFYFNFSPFMVGNQEKLKIDKARSSIQKIKTLILKFPLLTNLTFVSMDCKKGF